MSTRWTGAVLLGVLLCIASPSLHGQETLFVRGDANRTNSVEIGDALAILRHLFVADFTVGCEAAADADDSGGVNIADAMFLLEFLFQDGPPIPAPSPRCGPDPTPDGLSCDASPCGEIENSIRISEVMASNSDTLVDSDGDSSDWFELAFLSDAPADSIDLGGWYVTDDPTLNELWQIPAGVSIERGGFLVIFASGKDRAVAGEELHADFRLDADGDYVALVGPDGVTVVDELAPAYPEQLGDISYGLAQSTTTLVEAGSAVRYLVPTADDAALGQSWTALDFADGSWTAGNLGLGFSDIDQDGFDVIYMKANIIVDHIDDADDVRRNSGLRSSLTRVSASFINYFNTGGRGNFASDRPFPSLGFSDVNDFVVLVRGTILIPSAGPWSFGVNSDDGFSLRIWNDSQSFEMAHPQPRAPADTIEGFTFAEAGLYDVDLLFYERGGGASLEFFAAQGNRSSFTSDFKLVGDTANGGLALAGFASDIEDDIANEMQGTNASLWLRTAFDVEDPAALGGLVLRMKYADGFAAFLNGTEVARRNSSGPLEWNSAATSERSGDEIALVEEINLADALPLLRPGENILAIQAMNDNASDGNFLILPELVAAGAAAEYRYMETPTPGTFNSSGAIDFVRDVEFSVERGFFEDSFSLSLSTPTEGAQIRYTRNGGTPTATSGSIYDDSISVTGTSIIRAAAFKEDHLDSNVTTNSYLFVSDVIRQSPSGQAPSGWPSGSVNGQILDYGMDPDIVNSARWSSQMEDALLSIPSLSIVTDIANLFSSSTGIYVNARNDGRSWERRTSVELIHPDGSPGFGLDAGLRIRGAFSRSGDNPKHSLRLIFRNEYGAGKLRYPLFGGEGADAFDRVDLRTSQNYSWAFSGSDKNTFLRDVFSRDVMRDLRKPYTKSRYYHLYLNAQYWGLFQTEERADADFGATYLGGRDDDYDAIKNNSSGNRALEATDGTMEAYRRLYDAAVAGFSSNTAYRRVLGLRSDGTPDPNGEKLVDAQNLMDYMACTYYTGDPDAPVSVWGHISNNVFALYNRENPQGFSWFRHDAEHSLGANGGLNEGRLLTDTIDRSIGQEWRDFNPAWLHIRLTANREYRIQFADRVNQLFFGSGELSPERNIARWEERAQEIELAVIAASARWGDSKRATPRTKDDWEDESDWMLDTFFPRRTQIVLNQMRSVNMFPDAAIVAFNQHGGEVPSGFGLTMSQSNGDLGTILYTTDGTDPREWGGEVNPAAAEYTDSVAITETVTVNARVRDGSTWGAMTTARFTLGLEGLVINEIMAENDSVLEDPVEPGEFPDWIEFYNGTATAIDLGGMYLTDDPLDFQQWQIPAGVTIGPGEYLVFLADDDGTQGPLHTNYQLSRTGESVILIDTDGETVIDEVTFDYQFDDVSFGRYPDGADTWGFHDLPTPGAANTPVTP